MDIHVGDVLELKKEHPCGSRRWLVLRVGMAVSYTHLTLPTNSRV